MRFRSRQEQPNESLYLLADEDLMQLVGKSRADAFELIYDRHSTAAYGLAYRICGNTPMAEEVTQESFLSVWRQGTRYEKGRGSVRNWLLGIVHNRAIDAIRQSAVHSRRRATEEGVSETVASPGLTDIEVARREESESVRSALQSIPDDQRRVIELAYFGGFSHAEISEILDTPMGTVKGRMRLGLEKMRGQLELQGIAR